MNNIAKIFIFSLITVFSSIYSNIVWPGFLVTQQIFTSWFIIIISMIIEALFFYWLLWNISLLKALLMSIIGNIASAFVGATIMSLSMMLWDFLFAQIPGGTSDWFNIIATYIIMYIGTSLIELVTIKLIFKYSAKQIWIPVFLGNFLTYIIVALKMFSRWG